MSKRSLLASALAGNGLAGSSSASKPVSIEPMTLIQYETLIGAQLHRRYQRFLGDAQIDNRNAGSTTNAITTIHVPNTGPMTGLLDSMPTKAALSLAPPGSKRKYAHTLEWIQLPHENVWVGVHSAKANAMARALLDANMLTGLPRYDRVIAEVKLAPSKKGPASRVDFVLQNSESGTECHLEVKSVTLAAKNVEEQARLALFPDTVSQRAQRHVRELTALVRKGGKAALLFIVQRSDCVAFAPCKEKDPAYASLVAEAALAGVRLLAAAVTLDAGARRVRYCGQLPVLLDYELLDGQLPVQEETSRPPKKAKLS